MIVKKESPFISESGKRSIEKVDFSDTFSVTNHKDSQREIVTKIFGTAPVWVEKLFSIRNFFVKIIGLKNQKPEDYNTEYKVGGYVGFFQIYEISENETLLGLNDSHLNFRVSVYNTRSDSHNIKVTTLVKYNNTKGKIYMKLIGPFHELVVKRMVRQAYR